MHCSLVAVLLCLLTCWNCKGTTDVHAWLGLALLPVMWAWCLACSLLVLWLCFAFVLSFYLCIGFVPLCFFLALWHGSFVALQVYACLGSMHVWGLCMLCEQVTSLWLRLWTSNIWFCSGEVKATHMLNLLWSSEGNSHFCCHMSCLYVCSRGQNTCQPSRFFMLRFGCWHTAWMWVLSLCCC